MKTVFKAEIIWDTNDNRGSADAVNDLVNELGKRNGMEVVAPHHYPEDPIVVIFKDLDIEKRMEDLNLAGHEWSNLRKQIEPILSNGANSIRHLEGIYLLLLERVIERRSYIQPYNRSEA